MSEDYSMQQNVLIRKVAAHKPRRELRKCFLNRRETTALGGAMSVLNRVQKGLDIRFFDAYDYAAV